MLGVERGFQAPLTPGLTTSARLGWSAVTSVEAEDPARYCEPGRTSDSRSSARSFELSEIGIKTGSRIRLGVRERRRASRFRVRSVHRSPGFRVSPVTAGLEAQQTRCGLPSSAPDRRGSSRPKSC
jgi:hypothetical protein